MLGEVVMSVELPKQAEFEVIKEEFGEYRLEDGTRIRARVFLADLYIIGEDAIGPQIAYQVAVALRFIVPEEIRVKVKEKPIADRVDPKNPGWRRLKIECVKPAESHYIIDDRYELVLRLELLGAAKNDNYRTPLYTPHYQVRWTTVASIEPREDRQEKST